MPNFFQELHAKRAKAKYMLEMRTAAPPCPCPPSNYPDSNSFDGSKSPDVSLVLSDAVIEAAEDLDALGEVEWMEEMCDDGVDKGIDTEDDEFDGQLGTSRLVIASGEAQIEPFTPPHSGMLCFSFDLLHFT